MNKPIKNSTLSLLPIVVLLVLSLSCSNTPTHYPSSTAKIITLGYVASDTVAFQYDIEKRKIVIGKNDFIWENITVYSDIIVIKNKNAVIYYDYYQANGVKHKAMQFSNPQNAYATTLNL